MNKFLNARLSTPTLSATLEFLSTPTVRRSDANLDIPHRNNREEFRNSVSDTLSATVDYPPTLVIRQPQLSVTLDYPTIRLIPMVAGKLAFTAR